MIGPTKEPGLVLSGVVAVLLAGCSASMTDPVFVFEEVVAASSCSDDRLCLEVRAPVEGSRDGEGSCAVFGPGDPDDLDPLAERGDLEMRPGETTIWNIDVAPSLDLADLNPVCRPMIEG